MFEKVSNKMEFWILFGGRARSQAIVQLRQSGYNNLRVFLPKSRLNKMHREITTLTENNIDYEWIDHGKVEELCPKERTILITIGYPFLLSKKFIDSFSLALNLHPTLLPFYRGPYSGFYVIANGESESGATLHILDENMDSGPIVFQKKVSLDAFDTVRSMQKKVYNIEPMVLVEGLKLLGSDQFVPQIQDHNQATTFKQIRSPKDSELDASLPLQELFNWIRACDPKEYPAFFHKNGEKVFVYLSRQPLDVSLEEGL